MTIPLQFFVDKVGPVIGAAWCNQLDVQRYTVFGEAATKADARTALTVDAPLEVANGGTGQRTLAGLGAAIAGSLGANPSVTVGLTAKNGAASTYLRSDGAPALDVSIGPTWTGAHLFNGTFGGTGVVTYLTTPPPIGATTPSTGKFTTLTVTTTLTGAGVTSYLTQPDPIGSVTPNTGQFTNLTVTAGATIAGGLTVTGGITGVSNIVAWATFDGSSVSTVVANSLNMSSITKMGTGHWKANFASALSAATYAVAGTCHQNLEPNFDGTLTLGRPSSTKTTSACEFYTMYIGGGTYGALDSALITVIFVL